MATDRQQLRFIWHSYVNGSSEQRSSSLSLFLARFFIATHRDGLDVSELNLSSDVWSMCNLLSRDFLSDVHRSCLPGDPEDTGRVRHYLQKGRGWLLIYALLTLRQGADAGREGPSPALLQDARHFASILASLLRLLRDEMDQYPAEEIKGDGSLCLCPASVDACFSSAKLPVPTATGPQCPISTGRVSGRPILRRHRRVQSLHNCPPPPSDDSAAEGDRYTHENDRIRAVTYPLQSSTKRRHRFPDRAELDERGTPDGQLITYEITLLSQDDIENMFTDFDAADPSSCCETAVKSLPALLGFSTLSLHDLLTLMLLLLTNLCNKHLDLSRDVLPTLIDMLRPRTDSLVSSVDEVATTDACPLELDSGDGWSFFAHALSALCRLCHDLIRAHPQDTGSAVITGNRIFLHLFQLARQMNASGSPVELYFSSQIVRVSIYILAVHFHHLHSVQYFPSDMMKLMGIWIADGGPELYLSACANQKKLKAPRCLESVQLQKGIIETLGTLLLSLKAARSSQLHREMCGRRIHRKCDLSDMFSHHNDSFVVTVVKDNKSSKVCCMVCLMDILSELIQDDGDKVQEDNAETGKDYEERFSQVLQVLDSAGTCCCLPASACVSILLSRLLRPLSAPLRLHALRLVTSLVLREMGGAEDAHCAHCVRDRDLKEVLKRLMQVILQGDIRVAGMALQQLFVLIKLASDSLRSAVLRQLVLPVLQHIQSELSSSRSVDIKEGSVLVDRLVSFGKYFLCLLSYLPCPIDCASSEATGTTLDLFAALAGIGHFRRYVYKVLETFVLASLRRRGSTEVTGFLSSGACRRRRRYSAYVPPAATVGRIISFLLGVTDFKGCIMSSDTPESSARLLTTLKEDTDIWVTYETLFVHSDTFRLRFVDANGSDAAYLVLKEVILWLGRAGAEAVTSEMMALFESLLVLVMEGARIRKDFFYSGYSCEVIYTQLEALLLQNFPSNLPQARLVLQSLLNTCGPRGENLPTASSGTEHVEKMLHVLCNKFSHMSDDEPEVTRSTGSDESSSESWGYQADVDSDTELVLSDTGNDLDASQTQTSPERPLPPDLAPAPGLLRLCIRVCLYLDPHTFHTLQEHVMESVLPALKIMTSSRVRSPESTMLPTALDKIMQLLKTADPELHGLRSSVLNVIRVIGMNRLSVNHLSKLLETAKDNPACLDELLSVLTDVSRQTKLAPHWTLEYPVLVQDQASPSSTNDYTVLREMAALHCDLIGCGRLLTSSEGLTAAVWVRVDSRELAKGKKSPFKDGKKKGMKEKRPSFVRHFRSSSSASSNTQTSATGDDPLLPADQLAANFLHLYSLETSSADLSTGTSRSVRTAPVITASLQVWCEPASGTVYLRLYQQTVGSKKTRDLDKGGRMQVTAETGLRALLPLRRWCQLCVTLLPVAKATLKVLLSVNGTTQHELLLCHQPFVEDRRSTLSLRMGHQSIKEFSAVSKTFQMGNLHLFKDPIDSLETALQLYCLGPDWLCHTSELGLRRTWTEEMIGRLALQMGQSDEAARLLSTAEAILEGGGNTEMIMSSLIAVYSSREPDLMLCFPGRYDNEESGAGDRSDRSGSSFFSDWVKRVVPVGSTNERVGGGKSPSDVSARVPVEVLLLGVSRLVPALRESIDTALQPLGGVRVLLFLFAKVVCDDRSGVLQARALELLLTSLRRSVYLQEEFHVIGGYALLAKVVRSSQFVFSNQAIAIFINHIGSSPLIEWNSDSDQLVLLSTNRSVLCCDVYLLRDLLLTWPVWDRIRSGEGAGCVMLDAVLILVSESNVWMSTNAGKLQEARVVEAVLFACQERLQEVGNLPGEAFCSRLVSMIEACVGCPPDLDQLKALCQALLLLHPPANTFVTFEERTFYTRLKLFYADPQPGPMVNATDVRKSSQFAVRTNPRSQGNNDIDYAEDSLTLVDPPQQGSSAPMLEVKNADIIAGEVIGQMRRTWSEENQSDLVNTMPSQVEAQVMRRFYDLTNPIPGEDSDQLETQTGAGDSGDSDGISDAGIGPSDTSGPDDTPGSEEVSLRIRHQSKTDQSERGLEVQRISDVNDTEPDTSQEDQKVQQRLSAGSRILPNRRTPSEICLSSEDPGAVTLTCGLLGLLSDVLLAKLPDAMVTRVLGQCLTTEMLVTLAMHPSAPVREKVLETFFSYLTLAHRFTDHLTKVIQLQACLLLANQIHQFPATDRLVEVSFAILIGQEHLVVMDTRPSEAPPVSPTFSKHGSAFLRLTSDATQGPLLVGWGRELGYRRSFPLVLALLEKTAHDMKLCSNMLRWLDWILKSPRMMEAAIECGLCECLLNFLHAVNASHVLSCPSNDLDYRSSLADFQGVMCGVASWLVLSPDPAHMHVLMEMVRALQAMEDLEVQNRGADSCCVESCRHVTSLALQSSLEAVGQFAARPVQDLLPTELSMLGRRATLMLPIADSAKAYSFEESSESPQPLSDDLGTRHSLAVGRTVGSGGSEIRELSAKDMVPRLRRLVDIAVDFLVHSKTVTGPLTREKKSNLLFERSLFEFLLKAMVESTVQWALSRKNLWSSLVWNAKDKLKVKFCSLLVHLTMPSADLATRSHVVQTLGAEPRQSQIMKLVFSGQMNAGCQLLCNLQNLCSTQQSSSAQTVMLSSACDLLVRSLSEVGVSPAVAEEEGRAYLAERISRRDAWTIKMQHTVDSWKARFSAWSAPLTEQSVNITQLEVLAQNGERKRFIARMKRGRADDVQARRTWVQLAQHLTHERAIWHDPTSWPTFWQLDPTEGPSRVRKRLMRCHINLKPSFLLPENRDKLDSGQRPPPLHALLADDDAEGTNAAAATVYQLHTNDKIWVTARCLRVGLCGNLPGEFLLGETSMHFVGDDDGPGPTEVCTGYHQHSTITWHFDEVKELYKRRYELRDIALEIFLTNGKTYLLAMETTKDRNMVFARLDQLSLPNRAPRHSLADLQALWLAGHTTNFDYLTQLNTAAGRTYNDLMQYPIFPFIIKDYTSGILDLTRPDCYRSLDRPIAVQRSEQADVIRRKFAEKATHYREVAASEAAVDMFSAVPPFHYSSHYSNSSTVLHYLLRLPPFTTKFIQFQDQSFDVPDRAFHSVEACYRLSTHSPSCVKELIPEFFYLPEFLENTQGFDLGERQNGVRVHDVQLPPWCLGDARLFTLVHKAALESSQVMDHLARWIDLIFGFKQMGKPAAEAVNLFHPYTYFGAINPEEIADPVRRRAIVDMIRNYGQTPKQIFLRRPHPAPRSTLPLPGMANVKTQPEQLLLPGPMLWVPTGGTMLIKDNKPVLESVKGLVWGQWVGSPEEPEAFITWRRQFSCPAGVLSRLMRPCPLTVSGPNEAWTENAVVGSEVGAHVLLVQGLLVKLTLRLDESVIQGLVLENASPGTVPPPPRRHTLVSLDPRWRGTALAVGCAGRRVYVGGETGVIHVYVVSLNEKKNEFPLIAAEPPTCLYGHRSAITCLSVCESYSLLASGDAQGLTLLWDTNRLIFVRSLDWPVPGPASSLEDRSRSDQPLEGVSAMAFSETLGDLAVVRRSKQGRRSQLWVVTVNGRTVGNVWVSSGVHSMTYTQLPEGRNVNALALGMLAGRVRFLDSWRLTTVATVAIEQQRESPIQTLCYSWDARRLYLGDQEGWVYLLETREGQTRTTSRHFVPYMPS